MDINIFKVSMLCDCYLLECIDLSDTLSSVMIRVNHLLVMLAAGINKYPSFTMFEKLCKICMCLWLVPHFIPPLG